MGEVVLDPCEKPKGPCEMSHEKKTTQLYGDYNKPWNKDPY